MRALPALVALVIFTAACANPCQELAQKICACRPTEQQRQACETGAEAELEENGVTSGDQAFCEGKLATCECGELDTPQGKIDCGLALSPAP